MKRLTTTVACLLLFVFALAMCPATASATQITLNVPVDIRDIPADMGPLNLFIRFFDRNKAQVHGFTQPFSSQCTITGQTLSCSATIKGVFNADNSFYYQVIIRDKNATPLDQALQQRGVLLNGTPVIDTGILPLNP